ncbi:MAG: hypothetical protein C0523_08035, partial [Cytophaga sp.]|nr:hypothetical protein [Cytophaga sp.]
SVVSGPASLGTDNQTYTLNILEDDALFLLGWTTETGTTADLDMVYKKDGQVANYSFAESTDGSINTGGEGLYLPAGFPEGTYSMSYPYYSGTSNNVTFTVYMFNTAGTLNGKSYPYSDLKISSSLSYSGSYKTTNIHAYTDLTGTFTDVTYVAQTMVKSGINYTNISSITTTTNTSRTYSQDGILSPIKLDKIQLKKLLNSKLEAGRK